MPHILLGLLALLFLSSPAMGENSDFRRCLLAAKTPTIPAGLIDEAARLQSQWGSQMAELAQSGQPLNMIQPKMVDISRLQAPMSRPFVNADKLVKQGPFDLKKMDPIWVEEKNGILTITDGMTRVENARRSGVTQIPAIIFKNQ